MKGGEEGRKRTWDGETEERKRTIYWKLMRYKNEERWKGRKGKVIQKEKKWKD